MTKEELENYFDGVEDKYYTPHHLVGILEEIMGETLGELRIDASSSFVVLTEEDIKSYLERTFEEEDSELKRRIEQRKPSGVKNLADMSLNDVKRSAESFLDDLKVSRYSFDPYELKYFNKRVGILRNKVLLLLNIIDSIGRKDVHRVESFLNSLDINLDSEGKISKEDIRRLVLPTVYNTLELRRCVDKANNLETYITFKLSIDSIYRHGLREDELYPMDTLQTGNLIYDYLPGYVPLSENQRQKLLEERHERVNNFVKKFMK